MTTSLSRQYIQRPISYFYFIFLPDIQSTPLFRPTLFWTSAGLIIEVLLYITEYSDSLVITNHLAVSIEVYKPEHEGPEQIVTHW